MKGEENDIAYFDIDLLLDPNFNFKKLFFLNFKSFKIFLKS